MDFGLLKQKLGNESKEAGAWLPVSSPTEKKHAFCRQAWTCDLAPKCTLFGESLFDNDIVNMPMKEMQNRALQMEVR